MKMFVPSESDIQRIMQELKFDRMQAINHLRGQAHLQEILARQRAVAVRAGS